MANGKWQNSNGLQFAIFEITNHLPFDLCLLPFALLFFKRVMLLCPQGI
jgi:hypothetical protein